MSAKYKVGDLVHVSTTKSKFHEAKDWGICKIIMLHQSTGEFYYKLTLNSGAYTYCSCGTVLDRYIRDQQPENVWSIELLSCDMGYLCEDNNGNRVSVDDGSILSLKEGN